jgi:hypothetical protein
MGAFSPARRDVLSLREPCSAVPPSRATDPKPAGGGLKLATLFQGRALCFFLKQTRRALAAGTGFNPKFS